VSKKWVIKEANPLLKDILARQLHISPLLAQILLNRGLLSPEEAAEFLYAGLSAVPDPFLLKDLDRAVERIFRAVRQREKILVYGDYDADGITGTALLLEVLRRLGAEAGFYIPRRLAEGYGLHLDPVKKAYAQGFTLIITVDCGISNADVAGWCKANGGPDLIITDHHQVPPNLPAALAVINPRRGDCPYPEKELAGVGVALKLAQALLQEKNGPEPGAWLDYLDLACVGTVADVVPLLGENRLLVKNGLPRLTPARRPGLAALLEASGYPAQKIGTREISFGLAPRLNAGGRMGDARRAVELLLCRDPEEARQIARELEKANQQRQETEQKVFERALSLLEKDPPGEQTKIIILADESFHPGVTGIVASRLVEMYSCPVLLVSLEKDQGKGSGRSIPGFHLHEALASCREHLLSFGGHALAAGFTLKASELGPFSRSMAEYAARSLPLKPPAPCLEVDALVSLSEISPQLVNELSLLLPYGPGNPEPVLGCLRTTVVSSKEVGREGNHLKIFVRENGVLRDGIGFRLAGTVPEIGTGNTVHLAFTPTLDEYNGKTRVQLELKDISVPESPGPPVPEKEPAGSARPLPGPGKSPAPLPDFSRLWFDAYARFPGGALLTGLHPGESTAGFWQQAAAATFPGQRKTGFSPVDLRNASGKFRKLAALLDQPEDALILVNCPHQTVGLAERLRRSCGIGSAFFHPYLLSPDGRPENTGPPLSEKSRALITTTLGLASLPPERKGARLIIYHLPFNRREWDFLLRFAAGAGVAEICLLFGRGDRRRAENYLSSLAPDRQCLAHLYTLMRHRPEKNRLKNLAEYVCALRKRGFFWVGEHTVQIALAVFYELGLVSGGNEEYTFRPAPARKLDVRQSPTYAWGEKAKKLHRQWYEYLLSAPAKDLLALNGPDFEGNDIPGLMQYNNKESRCEN
jgi:single-stranded-DNA-specific exonuclease